MQESTLIKDKISGYMSEHGLKRNAFAEMTGVAPSTLDKVLAGSLKASKAFKVKVRSKTGLVLDVEPIRPFDFHLREYKHSEVSHLEGMYQTIRPSYRDPKNIHGYVTKIAWSDAHQCLIFEEINNDLSPKNAGYVSIPLYNRMMYFITCDKGNFRLAIVSDAYQDGTFYGAILTVGSRKMAEKVPTTAIFVIKKVKNQSEAVFGSVNTQHPKFQELHDLLKFGMDEGFFRALVLVD